MVEEIKKRILITGINGMLGQDLSAVLRSEYHCYGIDKIAIENNQKNFYEYDLCDKAGVKQVFNEVKPWLVIHAAAFTDVDGCEKDPSKAETVNFQGTKNIVDLCHESGAKLIFISTDYVFDGEKSSDYAVDDLPCPLNVYGQTKFRAEQLILSVLPQSVIVRTSWLFGKSGKNFVKTIIDKASQVDVLKIVNDQRGTPTYTVSLSEALEKLINSVFISGHDGQNYGIYHISNSENCTWYDFAKKIVDLCDINADVIPVDSAQFVRPAKRPKRSVLDNGRYEQVTKNKLCSWVQALQAYLAQS